MAKQKKKQESKVNRISQVFKQEYKYESLVLAILSLMVMVLGLFISDGTLLLHQELSFFGLFDISFLYDYSTEFAYLLLAIGATAFIYTISPVFKPSIAEMKKVSWPKADTVSNHSLRVFSFLFVMIFAFVLYDNLIQTALRAIGVIG